MANVLIYAPFAKSPVHFDTDMELAQESLDDGHKLTIVYCDGSLPTCESNPHNVAIACKICMARRDNGFKWLSNKNIELIPLDLDNIHNSREIENIINSMQNIENVRNFSLEGNDLGMAAISSTVSLYREPELLWEKHHKSLLNYLHVALLVYNRFKIILSEKSYDKVIFYNGRYSTFRPLLRLAQQENITIHVHERGPSFKKYSLTKDTYPHDINYIENQIVDFSKDGTPPETKEKIGIQWFNERQKHIFQNWTVFTKKQKDGCLPLGIFKQNFNIAIFISSEDEFVAIEEWKNPYYSSQNEGIEKILNDMDDSNVHFFLRVHPNLKNIHNSQTKVLNTFKTKYKNLTLIDADSEVSTYDLIKAVDLVITFGSSVGIEASFLNIPSIVMGKAPYLILNTCIQPINHDAMIEIIKIFKESGILPHTNNKNYLFGYYMKSYGKTFKYVKQTDLYQTKLIKNGKVTDLSYSFKILLLRIISKISSIRRK